MSAPAADSVPSPFDSVEEAIADIAAGRLVIVTDDEDRENEGDLIMAASKATPETINLMIRYGSGIVCVPMLGHQLDRLGLGPMVARNRESYRTAFTVSVDAAQGVTTGVSAHDRAVAIKILADPASGAEQLVQPGHVFPLRSRPGGVLERAGHTEAAVDLATLAGLEPAGILCELVNDDGTMQRLPQLLEFKKQHGLRMISIEQLIAYRLKQDKLVEKIGEHAFASAYGEFTAHVFRSRLDKRHHLALTLGQFDPATPALVRVHSANVLADVFRGQACGTPGDVLDASLKAIARERRALHGAAQRRRIDPRPPRPARRLARHGSPRLRHRRANPRRPRIEENPPAHQQPPQARGPRGLRHRAGRAARAPRLTRQNANAAGAPQGRPPALPKKRGLSATRPPGPPGTFHQGRTTPPGP